MLMPSIDASSISGDGSGRAAKRPIHDASDIGLPLSVHALPALPGVTRNRADAAAMTADVDDPTLVIVDVLGDGPFIHVGYPTALDSSPDLIVVGGSLGWAQWNGRSVRERSDRRLGWFPVGIYRSEDLSCRRLLTSGWEVNAVAIHPNGRLIAVGSGAYDGGYLIEGELLLHDLELGTTTSVLNHRQMVSSIEWLDAETLALVVAPPVDDAFVWPEVAYQRYILRKSDWLGVGSRSIDLAAETSSPAMPVERDLASIREELIRRRRRVGLTFRERREVWAVAPVDGGAVVGLESAIECWDKEGTLLWRRALAGTCTQLTSATGHWIVAAVWQSPEAEFRSRPTAVLLIDPRTGTTVRSTEPDGPAVLVTRADGSVLIRGTRHDRGEGAMVLTAAGTQVGRVELGPYCGINDYFDIRRAPEFLVLVGKNLKQSLAKRVCEVHLGDNGHWTTRDLFALAWRGDQIVSGGSGVFVEDTLGRGVVHTGIVHDVYGLQRGNAFVVRRDYGDGRLVWHVGLDNQVTALDEFDGRVIVVTNVGEVVVIDATSGNILGREERLRIEGHAVVPLSLAVDTHGELWIGTLDGRVIRVVLSSRS